MGATRESTMSRSLSIVSAVLIGLASASCALAQTEEVSGDRASFAEGLATYLSLDFEGARDIWRAVAEDESADAEERGNAYRALGRVTWRLWSDTDAALDLIAQADAVDPGNSKTFTQRAYALIAAGEPAMAVDSARDAVAAATNSEKMTTARQALGTAALALAGETGPHDYSTSQREALQSALEALLPAIENPPADVATSAIALAIAVRLGDGPRALLAWQSYYHSLDGVSAMADRHEEADVLNVALPHWSWAAPVDTHADVALALANSFFHDDAAYITTNVPALASNDPLTRYSLYNDFLDRIRTITNDYYRGYAVGGLTSDDYETALTPLFDQYGELLYPGQNLNSETLREFGQALETEFDVYANLGTTSGVLDLHMGHMTLDTEHSVSQYGYNAAVRYTVIGRMVSNGYESWVWDGEQQHGGWASADRIYQVRDGYADSPLTTWRQVTEPELREERDEAIAELRAADNAIADQGAVYLAGLALDLRTTGQRALYERLRAEVPADQLRLAFVTELATATRETSIFAHEGRHALDKVHIEEAQGINLPSEELEFRAKLSEVAFAPYPRLAFGAIFNANMGNGTSHGEANARVTEGLIAWMDDHRSEIAGLDASAPLLPQFDKLTDAQMVAAVQSMDPWATEAAN